MANVPLPAELVTVKVPPPCTPVTYTFPDESTAIPYPTSADVDPIFATQTKFPFESYFATNASPEPVSVIDTPDDTSFELKNVAAPAVPARYTFPLESVAIEIPVSAAVEDIRNLHCP